MEKLQEYQKALEGKSPLEILEWTILTFGPAKLTMASSLGAEDQVLTHMVAGMKTRPRVFTLDTGRVFEETYKCLANSQQAYGIKYEVYAPEAKDIEDLVASKGPTSFYDSVENRKECCFIRKVKPLGRALTGVEAWITGLRASQSVTREDLNVIEWDDAHKIYKINPLLHWSEEETWDYIKKNQVVYNKLHDQGFASIGCEPCTRAVEKGEDLRAGRWWWEAPEHKECGLHNRPNNN